MHANLVAQLTPAALKRLGGTDLEYDAAKLEQLADVVPDEQDAVLRAYLTLHVPWNDALVGKTLRSSAPPNPETPPPGPRADRRIERRQVSNVKPNRFNAALFPDSLGDASIAHIADDLARNGQRVPIEIMPDGEITDGERRWRGAQQLGWTEVDVVVGPVLTEDEILDRVLDSCTSSRQMSLREQVNVYVAVSERLKREAGREVGRPDQTIPKGIIYLTPQGIKEAAAKRAGFSSATMAVRTEAVFARGSEDLQAKVREGSVTVSAAYDQLPKRPKSKSTRDEAEAEPDQHAEAVGEAGNDALETSSAPDHHAAAPFPDATPNECPSSHGNGIAADTQEAEEEALGQADAETNDHESADEADGDDPSESDESRGGAENFLEDPTEFEERDIGVHVNAVCRHLSALAELNYEDAVAWFDQVVDEIRASLGEPPEFDDQEAFDE